MVEPVESAMLDTAALRVVLSFIILHIIKDVVIQNILNIQEVGQTAGRKNREDMKVGDRISNGDDSQEKIISNTQLFYDLWEMQDGYESLSKKLFNEEVANFEQLIC